MISTALFAKEKVCFFFFFKGNSPLCPRDASAALHPGSPRELGTSLEQKQKEDYAVKPFHRQPFKDIITLKNKKTTTTTNFPITR